MGGGPSLTSTALAAAAADANAGGGGGGGSSGGGSRIAVSFGGGGGSNSPWGGGAHRLGSVVAELLTPPRGINTGGGGADYYGNTGGGAADYYGYPPAGIPAVSSVSPHFEQHFTLDNGSRRTSVLAFHAAADLLIAASGREEVALWSLKKRSKVLSFFNGNQPGYKICMS